MPVNDGAVEQTRTADLILTKDALYLLSYNSICSFYTFHIVLYVNRVSTYFKVHFARLFTYEPQEKSQFSFRALDGIINGFGLLPMLAAISL